MQIGLGTLCGRPCLVAMATFLVTTPVLGACTGVDPGAGSVRDTRSSRPVASSAASSASPSAQPGVAESCTAAIEVAPLPAWAQGGFDPPDQSVRQVHGSRGQILGVVFADPLRAPAKRGYGNKILWLVAPIAATARPADPPSSEDLRIDASLIGSALEVRRIVPGGPGPSLVDMPRAGCWRFDLWWDGHQDTVMLPYSSP